MQDSSGTGTAIKVSRIVECYDFFLFSAPSKNNFLLRLQKLYSENVVVFIAKFSYLHNGSRDRE